MPTRQPLPRLWLMTDERQGDRLFARSPACRQAPASSFATTALHEVARRDLFERVKAAAPGPVLLAGPAEQAGPGAPTAATAAAAARDCAAPPVHSYAEIRAAERDGAALLFLSPAYPTRSHPEARPLGLARFAWLARRTALPVIALGGMNAARGRRLASFGAYGWAGIDAWAVRSGTPCRHRPPGCRGGCRGRGARGGRGRCGSGRRR